MSHIATKHWIVQDTDGTLHEVEAHYCFNNNDDGRGLVFRRHEEDDKRNWTEVVAAFAPGHWTKYELVSRV